MNRRGLLTALLGAPVVVAAAVETLKERPEVVGVFPSTPASGVVAVLPPGPVQIYREAGIWITAPAVRHVSAWEESRATYLDNMAVRLMGQE